MASTGRPSGGLLINPEAFNHVLGKRSQRSIAQAANISAPFLNSVLAGRKNATPELAAKLADELGCPIGVLFPETVGFTCQVKVFTHSGVSE